MRDTSLEKAAVEFSDEIWHGYGAKSIAEIIYAEVDDKGNRYLLLISIIDYHTKEHLKKTTMGSELLVKGKGGGTYWEPLASLKASHPQQVIDLPLKRLWTISPPLQNGGYRVV